MCNILFRADANASIGMGHVMRCLSIADAFRDAGHRVSFLIADDTVSELILNRGYENVVIDSDYQDMESELSRWPETLKPDILLVDSYYVTEDYLSHLQKKTHETGGKLVYIDDLLAFPYPVDVLINYAICAEEKNYDYLYSETEIVKPELVLGSQYAPLRSMFRAVSRKKQPERINNILISTGGADELHLTLAIIRYIIDSSMKSDCDYHILVGAMNADKEVIKKVASVSTRITIHENVSDMKGLIQSMDVCVSAAGSTLYEISACGIPLITYSLADNQIPGGEAFENSGLAIYVGDLRNQTTIDSSLVVSGELDISAVGRLMSTIEDLSCDYERRCEMGKKMQKLIDGYGADRIVLRMI